MESRRTLLNPWISMWTKPRATMQQVIETDPKRLVLVLAALSGISQALDRSSLQGLGDHYAWQYIVVFAALVGAIGGMVSLYVGAVLLRWTGRWINGTGSVQNIRAAIGWSSVPVIWALVLWIPQLSLFGQELFTTYTPVMHSNLGLTVVFFGFSLAEVVIGLWSFVVFFKCLAQVQGFSAWSAVGNTILSILVVGIPIVFIVAVAARMID